MLKKRRPMIYFSRTISRTFLSTLFCISNYGQAPALKVGCIFKIFFFSIWIFFHEHSRITGPQGKGKGISLTPHNHFHPLHRHLEINRTIAAESSPLHIASSRTRTGNFWFPSKSQTTELRALH